MNLLDEESGQIKLVLAGGAGNQKEYEEIKELAAHCRYPVRFAGLCAAGGTGKTV